MKHHVKEKLLEIVMAAQALACGERWERSEIDPDLGLIVDMEGLKVRKLCSERLNTGSGLYPAYDYTAYVEMVVIPFLLLEIIWSYLEGPGGKEDVETLLARSLVDQKYGVSVHLNVGEVRRNASILKCRIFKVFLDDFQLELVREPPIYLRYHDTGATLHQMFE